MGERKRSAVSWTACKAAMKHWPQAGVVALVHEPYKMNDANRSFLHARLLAAAGTQAAYDAALAQIRRRLSLQTVYANRFRHADVKRVIDGFEKSTDDRAAVARLVLADLTAALETYAEIADFEPLVDHCYAMLTRLDGLLAELPAGQRVEASDQLARLAERYGGSFGYGLSDELVLYAEQFRARAHPSD